MPQGKQIVGRLDAPRQIRMGTDAIPQADDAAVVVKVACTGICGTDLAFYREGAPVAGAVLGHEFSGTIIKAGSGVTGMRPGDRVVANPMINLVGLGRVPGSFAEYLQVPSAEAGRNIFPLPDSISDDQGALIEPFAVGLHAVNRSGAAAGQRVAVFGAGPIGLCVLAGLKVRGVKDVLVIDPSDRRRELALSMGATAVHDPRAGSSVEFAASHFGSEKTPYAQQPIALADIIFDCAGVTAALDHALHSLARRGKLVLVADPHDANLPDLRLVMLRELQVMGALAYDGEFRQAIDLMASGTVDLTPLITHRFPLSQLDKAFEAQMDAQNAVKVIVTPG